MKILGTRLRVIAGSLVAAAMSVPAYAQFVPGQLLTATQLNAALQTASIQNGAINGATIGNSRPSSGAFTSLAASTSNPSLLFNLGGVGASDRALQAILQEQKISVIAFGADPTGTRPSATAIQNAVNFACASPSQKTVYEPPGTFLWDHNVTINCPAVKLIGAGGGGYNDNSPNINATTINRWVGPQGGTALTITPSSDQKTEDNSVMGIFWDGNNSLGGIAVNLVSARYGTYDIRAAHWATAFVQTDISPAATENSDVTGNIFYNISGYQTLPTDGSVLITNSAFNHNACWNHFFLIQAVYLNSPGVVLNGDDSERFDVINLYNADNGTAKGLVLNGSNTSPYANTRHNTFYLVGTGGQPARQSGWRVFAGARRVREPARISGNGKQYRLVRRRELAGDADDRSRIIALVERGQCAGRDEAVLLHEQPGWICPGRQFRKDHAGRADHDPGRRDEWLVHIPHLPRQYDGRVPACCRQRSGYADDSRGAILGVGYEYGRDGHVWLAGFRAYVLVQG
ncbi:glycoside hydrolase family 55 protein [Burkholderia sp. LMG 13014]|uniref:glycoside hydrolase family 55 protein n=1 Tax=Burkholderia sp. LMG 13014 TaxID=2709306 RepID=UPI001F057028|nr:glycoside hydrolase family 55 protein [Burkholderia sp. LMG 13014]